MAGTTRARCGRTSSPTPSRCATWSADIRDRAADARLREPRGPPRCPAARDAYRRLDDYAEDLKKLVDENPGLVRPITLPHETWEGRSVEGVEITTDVNNLRDGKPVFLQMGVHHAREWPSGEHAIEWAFELVNGYKGGDARTRLVEDAHDRDPDGQPRRLQHLARGRRGPAGRRRPRHTDAGEEQRHARRTSSAPPLRVPAQELPPARAEGGNCASPAGWPRRGSTPTATTARSGAARARAATSPTRPTTARPPSPSPRRRTCASSSPGGT